MHPKYTAKQIIAYILFGLQILGILGWMYSDPEYTRELARTIGTLIFCIIGFILLFFDFRDKTMPKTQNPQQEAAQESLPPTELSVKSGKDINKSYHRFLLMIFASSCPLLFPVLYLYFVYGYDYFPLVVAFTLIVISVVRFLKDISATPADDKASFFRNIKAKTYLATFAVLSIATVSVIFYVLLFI